MSFDNVCKILAEKYPEDFVRWLIGGESTDITVLKTELSLEPIRADSVIFIQTNNRILHLEFQTLTKSKPSISFRTLDYSVRLKRQYKCPVVQVVIFLQETDNEIAFTEQYMDDTTIHRYRAVRMWEQDSSLFLGNVALLPLAPLCRTDSPRELLSQVSQEVARISDRETRQNTAAYTEILAGLRFEKDLIRQLLSEDIMQESVIYQDILQKGEERTIIRQLNRRFGEINSSLIDRIKLLPIEKLDTLAEALLDFSAVSDLISWFEQNTSS
ncbi:MAG: Rpn family recombination-promoting nuclease/putative transposase [Methylacidiphilales bacterium]|nr:Rpn family recombination-promoting nuclease/putative transposase [Candidatus Methylacidiphilales bacterium]NJR17765.1 Rpn family recombination-promoting nuclease/putative transposase [Calothrix sp. CSU_2_0]